VFTKHDGGRGQHPPKIQTNWILGRPNHTTAVNPVNNCGLSDRRRPPRIVCLVCSVEDFETLRCARMRAGLCILQEAGREASV
jgi:hypothetical protein